MPAASGFLVVSINPEHIRAADPRYRGLYRTPPFDQRLYDSGFDDPYLTDEFVNEEGLLPDMDAVGAVMQRFSSVMPVRELEVLYATAPTDGDNGTGPPPDSELLGYDVACFSPFWSVVADPPLDGPLPELNAYGLVASREAGEAVRNRFRDTPDGRSLQTLVWEVWRVAP